MPTVEKTIIKEETIKPEGIPELIAWYAEKNGASTTTAVAIAKAESNFVPNAKNASSSASGIFQYINGTFKSFCIEKYKLTDTMEDKNDISIQADCATRMLAEGGEHHWSESAHVWDK